MAEFQSITFVRNITRRIASCADDEIENIKNEDMFELASIMAISKMYDRVIIVCLVTFLFQVKLHELK